MSLPIALQLYTVREAMAADFAGTLKQVAAAGYRGVEGAGMPNLTAAQIKAAYEEVGLTCMGNHTSLDHVMKDAAGVVEQARFFGYRYVTCSFLGEQYRTPEGYRLAAQQLTEAAKQLGGEGIQFCYHNHAFEFETLEDGSLGYDILTQASGPELAFQLDVMWAVWGNQDPVQLMKKLAGRVPLLHIKDTPGHDKDKTFTEVGTGIVDLPAIIAAAPSCGSEHLIVEQDRDWIDGDAVKSAKISYENLAKAAG